MDYFMEKGREVMKYVEPIMLAKIWDFLKPIDENWQPAENLLGLILPNNMEHIINI